MNVNDDAVVLKGGKGTYADTMAVNGPVERVLVQNCHYGTVHSMLTLGSESLHDRNIIMRNCTADDVTRVLWLKMRPDTPQQYEYVTVENITGKTKSGVVVRPWTQFFKPMKRDDMSRSYCRNITLKNIKMTSDNFFNIASSDKYDLSDFTFENIEVNDKQKIFTPELIKHAVVKNVKIK